MTRQLHIQYLSRSAIDLSKWNACIDNASNGLIYGSSLFLDTMCTNWDALVLNDYEAVIPLPWRKKWGVKYIYQPAFMQQSGVFGALHIPENEIGLFLEKAMEHFRYGEINLNNKASSWNAVSRNNYILPLLPGYARIRSSYKTDLKKNLKKSGNHVLQYAKGANAAAVIGLFKKQYQQEMKFADADYVRMSALCQHAQPAALVHIRLVFHQKELAGGCLCLQDTRRIYLLLSAVTDAGRKLSANHFLLDRLIEEFSGQPLILDFEGSDIPGIAHFYKNFGAIHQPYYFVGWNHLPWPLRLMKPANPSLKKNEVPLHIPSASDAQTLL